MATASPLGVFINCPFDSEYQKYFDAIVFAGTRLGFVARCARKVDDGSGTRIAKIIQLIKECPYGIHDLSRMGLDPTSKLPRFNMPFELGIFIGAKHYGSGELHKKKQFSTETTIDIKCRCRISQGKTSTRTATKSRR
jgi:hypothetical protein